MPLLLAFGLLLWLPSAALGHATGESYVWLNVEPDHLEGRFEIAVEDLGEQLGLEIPSSEEQARREVLRTAPQVQQYLRSHFSVAAAGAELPLSFTGTELIEVPSLGYFAVYHYRTAEGDVPDQLEVGNTLFFATDRFHRSLLMIERDAKRSQDYGEEFTALVFSPANSQQTLDLTDIRGLLRVRDFVWQGILHIWIGIDHVLFLIALLLTAVLMLANEKPIWTSWRPVDGFSTALWNIIKIVTIFTVSHSITLSLAALGLVRLPSRLVESIIALSIVLVVANNLFPKFNDKNWLLIFLFGLFHGMGFASVMGELPFRMRNLIQVILAFNIGVELGQLAIVAAVFPLLFLLRRWVAYKSAILAGGSLMIGILAAYWLAERALAL